MANPYDAAANASGSGSGNPYDGLVSSLEERRAQRAREAAVAAKPYNPDQYARAAALAKQHGVAPSVVADNLPDFEDRDLVDRVSALAVASPITAAWLTASGRMPLAKDDLDVLGRLEQTGRYFYERAQIGSMATLGGLQEAAGDYAAQPLANPLAALYDVAARDARTRGDVTAEQRARAGADAFRLARTEAEGFAARGRQVSAFAAEDREAAAARASRPNSILDAVTRPWNTANYYGGILAESTPGILAAMATRRPQAASAVAGLSTGGASYGEARREGGSVLEATRAAVQQGGIESALSGPVFDIAFSGAKRRVLKTMAAESGSEALTTLAQTNVDDATEGTTTPVRDQLLQALDAALVGAPSGAVEGALGYRAARRAGQTIAAGEQAGVERQQLDAFVADAMQAKVRARSPEDFEALVREQTGDAMVYLPAEALRTLYQSANVDPSAGVADLTGDADAWDAALATGAEIAVPLSRYVMRLGEQHASLAGQVRLVPGEDVRPDTAMPTPEEVQADIAAAMAEAREQDARQDGPAGQVFDEVYGQLLSKVDEATARQQAAVAQAFYRTMADRVGTDAFSLWQRFQLNIEGAQAPAGPQRRGVDIDVDPLLDALRTGKLPTDREIYGETISSALVAAGGITDTGGELRSQDALRQRPGLINLAGMTMDDALVWARDNGFIEQPLTQELDAYDGDAPDINTLIDLLTDDLRGNPVYRRAGEGGRAAANEARLKFREDALALQEQLDEAGIDLQVDDNATVRAKLGVTLEQGGARSSEPFYSAALAAIEEGKGAPKRGNAQAWKGWLDGAVRRGDMKQSERDWLGIDAWLEGRESTTREELAEFVRANQVQVQDVTLGDSEQVWEYRGDGRFERGDVVLQQKRDGTVLANDPSGEVEFATIEEAKAHYRTSSVAEERPTKFSAYQLPGGKNYRELLLTLPPSVKTKRDRMNNRVLDLLNQYGSVQQMPPAAQAEVERINLEYNALPENADLENEFRSSHFDQPNIIAHVRFNERTDADGKRVLFIEEIQSDWHQAGRRSGYKAKLPDASKVAAANRSFNESAARGENAGDWRRANPEHAAVLNAGFAADQGAGRVPDAPFKATDEWAMLAFKRMVRHAAENGFDRIAWTTGEQQAERYDLSKQVSQIRVVPGARNTAIPAGTRFVQISMVGGQQVTLRVDESGAVTAGQKDAALNGKKLDEVVGKEAADKIMAADKETALAGGDLRVGGEGMRAFYDKILPAAVNKWAKRFGGRVGEARITTLPADQRARDADLLRQLEVDVGDVSGDKRAAVHAIDVTPAMRDAALGGMTLFQSAVPEPDDIAALRAKLAEAEAALGEERRLRRTSDLTGLRNKLAFDEDADLGWPEVVAIDLDGLKRMNDALGHAGADEVLRVVGAQMAREESEGLRFYHRSGDEFAVRSRDEGAAAGIMERLRAVLDETAIDIDVTAADGSVRSYTVAGAGISYGIGDSYEVADARATADKDARLAAGLRDDPRAAGPSRRVNAVAGSAGRRQGDRPGAQSDRRGVTTLNQSGGDQTDTPAFRRWAQGAPLVDDMADYEGGPAVFRLFHGTTADFDTFDRDRANPESDFGAGFYFSNTPEDVGSNYAGMGPDLTQKIELEAERIARETDRDYDDPEVVEQARARWVQNDGATMPVFVRALNPAVVGGDNETRLTYEEPFDEETEEYGEPTGTLVDFMDALRALEQSGDFMDLDAEAAIGAIMEDAMDGDVPLSVLVQKLKSSEGLQYAADGETGAMASSEIIRRALEGAGFDAVVDYTVDVKFGSQRRIGKSMAGMREDTVHVIAFEPTQIKSAIGNRGTFDPNDASILNQRGARGSITFGPADAQGRRVFNIRLLDGADLSTFLHEGAHAFLEIFGDLAQDADAPAQVREDYAKVLAFLGVADRSEIAVEHHEKFARGFEAYYRAGSAPSGALRRAFARFKVWLHALYRTAASLDVTLSDEVRGVFDRLLATDAEIAEARDTLHHEALIVDALEVGMSQAQYDSYRAAVEAAKSDAEAALAAEVLREQQRAQKAFMGEERRKLRAEVEADTRNLPVYRAMRWLRNGKLPDGSPVPEPIKLDKDALLDDYGQSFLRNLSGMYAVQGGVKPDEAAALLGFDSGSALVHALVNAPKLQEVIDADTDRILAERYPDPMTDGTLPDRALAAAHRTRQADIMLREVQALERHTGGKVRTHAGVLQQAAREIIEGRRVRDVQPNSYRVAEAKAGREAFAAAAAQDWPAAAAARRRQLLNHHLYTEAKRVRADADAIGKRLRKFQTTKVRAKLGRAGGDYLEQIDGLLERFDFRPISAKAADRRTALAAWIEAKKADGVTVSLPQRLLDEAFSKPYRELTVIELREINEAVVHLAHLANLKNRLLLRKEQRDRADVDGRMAESVKAAHGVRPDNRGDPTARDKARLELLKARGLTGTASDVARELDGFADVGGVWQNTVQIVREANDETTAELDKAAEALATVYRKHYTVAELRDLRTRRVVPELGDSWSKGRVLALALNWGNDGNREAIRSQGRGKLTDAEVGVLLGRLTARDWQFVQDVWDLIDGYWPTIAETEKRRTGLVPAKVDRAPFGIRTADGAEITLRGGYFPLKYEADSAKSMREEADDFYDSIRTGRFAKAATKDGHTIERVGSGGRRVMLDLGVIDTHLRDVVRDLYLGDAVNYVYQALRGPSFTRAVDDAGLGEMVSAMDVWLKDVAAGEMGLRYFHDRALRALRTNFTASVLTYKAVSAALQVTGIVQTSVVIGKRHALQGVAAYTRAPRKMARYVDSVSPFMARRVRTHIDAVQEVMNARSSRFESGRQAMMRWGYWMIGRVQRTVDLATWLGAEAKGLEQFDGDVAKARAYADDVVARAQGSGDFVDKSPLQRGTLGEGVRQSEAIRTTTALMGYMIAKSNVAYGRTRVTDFRKPREAFKWMGDMLNLFVVEAMIVAVIRGNLPDDEEEDGTVLDDWALLAAKEGAANLFGGIPGLSQMVTELRGYDAKGVVASAWGSVGRATEQLKQGELDKAAIKSVVTLHGFAFGVPSAQINKTIDAIDAKRNGEDVLPHQYLTGLPKD